MESHQKHFLISKQINISEKIRLLVLIWENPAWSLILALIIYSIISTYNQPLWSPSPSAYYNYLADAFLHHQFNLRVIPPSTHDLVLFNHQYFLYWPPMPAILLMPFIAIYGIGFSDIVFTLFVAALNVSLVAYVLRKLSSLSLIELTKLQRALLVIFFTLGTVHITLSPFGRVWFTGQLVGFLFCTLAYISAIRFDGKIAFFFCGLSITGALLTRNTLIFLLIWPAVYLIIKTKVLGYKNLLISAFIGILPIIFGIGFLAYYNWARFNNPLDIGYTYHLMSDLFTNDFHTYGAFNIRYLCTNLYYQYIAYPLLSRPDTFYGGSLFLLSPLFIFAFLGLRNGRPRWSIWALAATIILVDIPILLLMGTGWVQFGPRYTLDFTLPLLLLTAYGIKNLSNQKMVLLIAISIIQYLAGTLLLVSIF